MASSPLITSSGLTFTTGSIPLPGAGIGACPIPKDGSLLHAIIVPTRGLGWALCTADRGLYEDYTAHGFCKMQNSALRDSLDNSCPWSPAELSIIIILGVVGPLMLLGLIVGAFVIGLDMHHDRLYGLRRYPRQGWRRGVVFFGTAMAGSVLVFPVMAWAAPTLIYSVVACITSPCCGNKVWNRMPTFALIPLLPFVIPGRWVLKQLVAMDRAEGNPDGLELRQAGRQWSELSGQTIP